VQRKQDLIILWNKVKDIMESPLVSWEIRYDDVFNTYSKSSVALQWCDPDTSYKEDVEAFVEALETAVSNITNKGLERYEELQKILVGVEMPDFNDLPDQIQLQLAQFLKS